MSLKPFVVPTVEEVAAFCRDRANSIDAEAFVAYYAARGWRTKTGPVKNWQACVVTWEKNDRERRASKPGILDGLRDLAEEYAADGTLHLEQGEPHGK